MSFIPTGLDDTTLITQGFHVADVGSLFCIGKGVYAEAFTGLRQAFGRGRAVYLTRLEELYPLVKRSLRHTVKVVHAQDVVFGENVACILANEYLLLTRGQAQHVVRVVQAAEDGLTVVNVILPLSEAEIDDVDGVDLTDLVIGISQVDVFGDGLRHAVEHPVEIVKLPVVLHLDDEKPPPCVLHEDVGTVELVGRVFLVRLAFQEATDAKVFAQQGGKEAFKHHVVALVAKQTFHGPIEADKVVFHKRAVFLFLLQM